jgi:hypothetical protein
VKNEPEFVSVVPSPTCVRGGSMGPLAPVWGVEIRLVKLLFRIWNAASIWASICSSVIGIGKGTKQQESTMILGRPVTMLRVLSSEYKDHHVRIKLSRFATVAEGFTLRTWSPSAYAKRTATLTIVHALSNIQHMSIEVHSRRETPYSLTCPTDSQ